MTSGYGSLVMCEKTTIVIYPAEFEKGPKLISPPPAWIRACGLGGLGQVIGVNCSVRDEIDRFKGCKRSTFVRLELVFGIWRFLLGLGRDGKNSCSKQVRPFDPGYRKRASFYNGGFCFCSRSRLCPRHDVPVGPTCFRFGRQQRYDDTRAVCSRHGRVTRRVRTFRSRLWTIFCCFHVRRPAQRSRADRRTPVRARRVPPLPPGEQSACGSVVGRTRSVSSRPSFRIVAPVPSVYRSVQMTSDRRAEGVTRWSRENPIGLPVSSYCVPLPIPQPPRRPGIKTCAGPTASRNKTICPCSVVTDSAIAVVFVKLNARENTSASDTRSDVFRELEF